MSLTKEKIVRAAQSTILKDCIPGNPEYQWIDIVGIPQRPNADTLKSSLYVATHSDGSEGWDDGFDRRSHTQQVNQKTGWDIVTDGELGNNTPGLQVNSVDEFIRSVYGTQMVELNPFVIGVTGSVGKTTLVAFLEHLISSAGIDCVRFYSKRLTPYSVMTHFINRVLPSTRVVVMEYSAYWPDHVTELAKALTPNLAFLTNIYQTHLNPGTFSSKQDILDSKAKIKLPATQGYVNRIILNELELRDSSWKIFDVEIPPVHNPYLPPTLRTAELYAVGRFVAEELNLPARVVDTVFGSFIPPERRIEVVNFRGSSIFFHGETSGGSRLWSWFETADNTPPWFLVEEINFADEDPKGFEELLEKVFGSDRSYVLDTKNNRNRLSVKANFVSTDQFRDIITNKAKDYVVYHKALSTRETNFDPQKHIEDMWG
jgi:hypothetical protein